MVGGLKNLIFMKTQQGSADFTKNLLKWNRQKNTREMPWKAEKDPYRIWLSEVILQQTRVEQGWNYYEKFVTAFPDVFSLARAPEKKVFKLWEGLGYYNRCRNLIATAKKIVRDYKGHFPDKYDEIRALKGIGPYTAAAIASFAFGLPYAVVDGNVERVLSRYFGINTAVDSSSGKKLYAELADALMDKKNPGIYNQAMMDFGAVICKPQQPLCQLCVQAADCVAYQQGWVSRLPVKEKKIARKNRWLYYFIIETRDGRTYIRQRQEQDIWRNLYEFVVWEAGKAVPEGDIVAIPLLKKIFLKRKFTVGSISTTHTQQLTHQVVHGRFISISIDKPLANMEGYLLVTKKSLSSYPFPKMISSFLQRQS